MLARKIPAEVWSDWNNIMPAMNIKFGCDCVQFESDLYTFAINWFELEI